ncbi:condensation domain-containing protein [Streptantibioticus cattleyicolor]|uniref:Non-ribosomal peptide synthetase/polyketide synthase n=1 Tax=Streptantibioticus cattleyicolor (strain ATCC 35852 / DSM 46488 / JCM 4925 / NBRC 14057 / NRRL 8057) TaxID=1003195 RepID=F8JJQ0_STREN|nr:condensation domain-containing protein [Streptantibioticus cattleyicolor]AEW99903.1 non-ribosomal peptide synthetase/polyketide synthase [Streptantibioticus cattleyicolor NRRL 8057 = DSM 46488]CCB71064.1 protein of unknown function [Streptantibioticus cattleyicolor NRRL 8057 = DSM 46488]
MDDNRSRDLDGARTTLTQHLPLSVNQEAMWVTWQIDPTKWEHIIPLALDVKGVLDLPRLRAAVAQLSRRHPMLRARVRDVSGHLCLDWAGTASLPVTVRAVTAPRDEAVIAARSPFDLDEGPLARVEVLEGPDYTVLLITVHHIVLDGTATPLLLDDLRRAYAGEDLGLPEDLTPLVDHARRSREAADGAIGEESRRYWRDELADMPPARTLPVRSAEGARALTPFTVDAQLSRQARRLARELGVSYFTVMLGALFITLSHHTGSDDLIVSAPYHGRSDKRLGERVGYFVNVLPFRQKLCPSDTYERFLRKLRTTVRDGLKHGDLPLPSILRAAHLVGPDARAHTHQVVFEYWDTTSTSGLDVHRFELVGGGSRCRLSYLDSTDVADYRLTAQLNEGSTGSRMLWKDPGGTVGPTALAALTRDYLSIVADMVADPGRTLGEATARLPAVVLPDTGGTEPAEDTERPREPAGTAATPASAAMLGEIWREVLRIPEVSADDSFFELGGHSLLATTLLNRITERLGVELSVRDLFSHPRFGRLAEVIDDRRAAAPVDADDTPHPEETWEDVFPASVFQESIWLAERLDPAHAKYHIPLLWKVRGTLDGDALSRALALLVSRHEILRTRFVDKDGRLYQEVTEPWAPLVDRLDVTAAAEAGQRQWLRKWSDTTTSAFDPSTARLLAAGWFSLPDGGQLFSLCLHHLVLDGESVPVLVRDLERCYQQAAGLASGPLPEPGQYRELVFAQQTESARSRTAADLAYWQDHLSGAPASLGLAGPRAAGESGNIPLRLDGDTAQRLTALGTERNASRFMVTAAALAAVLHRASGLPDITFGVPVASRSAGVFDDVIGPCMNTLVLRSRCGAETTYSDLLRTVREEVIAAFEHQSAPFDDVVRRLRPPRSRGRTPFVDCLLNSVGMDQWSATLGDARLVFLDQDLRGEEVSKFPLTVTFTTAQDVVEGNLAYRGDCLDAAGALRLTDEITTVLGDFTALLPRRVFDADPTREL